MCIHSTRFSRCWDSPVRAWLREVPFFLVFFLLSHLVSWASGGEGVTHPLGWLCPSACCSAPLALPRELLCLDQLPTRASLWVALAGDWRAGVKRLPPSSGGMVLAAGRVSTFKASALIGACDTISSFGPFSLGVEVGSHRSSWSCP